MAVYQSREALVTSRIDELKAELKRAMHAFKQDPTPRLATAIKQTNNALKYERAQNRKK